MRQSIRIPSGRPTAPGSCSARTGRGNLPSTRCSRSAEWRSSSWRPPTRYVASYSWSVDGRGLLYGSIASQGNVDLWIVPMVGERTPRAFLKTPFREAYGVFSPDGLWVAYQSNESGRPEVYVRPVVPPSREASTFASATADKSADKPAGGTGTAAAAAGGQWQVSTAGGVFPAWRPDGKELYLPQPRWRDDGGVDHRHRDHARTGRAGGALSHARRRRRRGHATRTAVPTSAPTDGS